MKATKLAIALSLMIAVASTAFASEATITLSSWVKSTEKNAVWQETATAKPGDTMIVRIDAKNVSSETIENGTVQIVLPKNLVYKGNLVVDYRDAKLYKGDIIALGTMVPNRTKMISFQVKVAEANYNFGTTELAIVSATNQETADIETTKIVVHKKSVQGINIGPVTPTAVDTGLNSTFMDFVAIPMLLSALAVVLFRKQLLALSTGYTSSVHRAEYDIARMNLEKKIDNLKK